MKQLDLMQLVQRAREESEEEGPELHVFREECPKPGEEGLRVCPWISCRHHLAIEVRRKGRSVFVAAHPFLMRDGELQLNTGAPMCSLDVADLSPSGISLEVAGWVLGGLTRERVNQVLNGGLRSMRAALGGDPDTPNPRQYNEPTARDRHRPKWMSTVQRLAEEARKEGRRWMRL